MSSEYFHRVAKETPTRFWINNPTIQEIKEAIAAWAINMTSNPSYASKLLQNESGYIEGLIDAVIKETKDDDQAADLVNQRAVARALEQFLPLYEQSGGEQGYVTIQGDPRVDDNADIIIEDALRHRRLGENLMVKIPVILAGTKAMETLIAKDIPICATEVFSISQAVYFCELYKRISRESGKKPKLFVTHITGIFDEYLENIVRHKGIQIAPEVLAQAGCAVARKEYRILKERRYETTMLGGGARGTQHFTELVGGDVHITINWSTAQQLIEDDGPVVSRIDAETPKDVISELTEKLPDFRRAFYENGLSLEEFKDYGPVMLFRGMFLKGYYHLLGEIAMRRALYHAG